MKEKKTMETKKDVINRVKGRLNFVEIKKQYEIARDNKIWSYWTDVERAKYRWAILELEKLTGFCARKGLIEFMVYDSNKFYLFKKKLIENYIRINKLWFR